MNKAKRILLSIEQQVWKELVGQTLESQADVEIVGESCNYIECLAVISQNKPDIWIHSAQEGPDLKAMTSRAYELIPDLVIVRVDPDEPVGYLQVQVKSIIDVLGFANQMHSEAEPAFSSYQ